MDSITCERMRACALLCIMKTERNHRKVNRSIGSTHTQTEADSLAINLFGALKNMCPILNA